MKIFLTILFLLSFSYSVFATDYTQDVRCKGAWLLDETSGNAIDTSSNSLDLVNTNVTYEATGAFGKAYSYNGSNAYSQKGSGSGVLDIATDFTIVSWFKAANLTQSNTYLMQYRDDSTQWGVIWEYVNNQVEFFASSYTGSNPRTGSGITIGDTNLHHIAYRYNGTAWSYFLDGVETVINASITFNPNVGTNGNLMFTLGAAYSGGPVAYINAIIDEPSVFIGNLSSTEINDIMDNGLVATTTSVGKVIMIYD